MRETFVIRLKEACGVSPGQHVLVAVSGGAASLHIATLLDKPERRRVPLHVDYFGFTIPDEFVVGYGLDYAEKYRNLPDIGVLRPEIYE